MFRFFISYRRDDSRGDSRALYERLIQRFGSHQIFMDVASLDFGVDFVQRIEKMVSSCDAVIAVMGPRWLDIKDSKGTRRLDNPEDFVRLEIATALKRGIQVIPVRVGGVRMPAPEDLPEDLRPLTRLQALEISDTRFDYDVGRLIERLLQLRRDDPDESISFVKWRAVMGRIQSNRCVPILGSGLLEPLIGSSRELAQSWADHYGYPMSPEDKEDLPQVAQYLASTQQADPPSEMVNHMRTQLLSRFGPDLPPDLNRADARRVISSGGAYLRQSRAAEPHKVLASLPFPIYFTTNPDNTMAEALIEAGREPVVEYCRWRETADWPPSIYDYEPNFRPTVARPMVYHLFGHLDTPTSLVITEDDYFDYLIGVTRQRDLIPTVVRSALTNSAVLFLGFRLDDWDFRAFFRGMIATIEGRSLGEKLPHVAVQLDPTEDRNINADGARRYLQSYFDSERISIYWGSVEGFAEQLQLQWELYRRELDLPV